jgi:hypothetical protein
MNWVAAAVALGIFAWSLKLSRAMESAGEAVSTARGAMAALLDPSLTDEDKERSARTTSLRMFGHAATITLRLGLALLVPVVFLAVLVAARILNATSLINTLESWQMILASTIIVTAALLWKR